MKHACNDDAETDSLTRIHAPVKDESNYHLTPLMNKAFPAALPRGSPRCRHDLLPSLALLTYGHAERRLRNVLSLPSRTGRKTCMAMFVIPVHAVEA